MPTETKRKQPEPDLELENSEQQTISTPKRRRTRQTTNGTATTNGHHNHNSSTELTPTKQKAEDEATPRKSSASTLKPSGLRTPTHRNKAKSLFHTPTKATTVSTPTRARNADRSAKKKSARLLLERDEEDGWDGADRLAEEILEDGEEQEQEREGDGDVADRDDGVLADTVEPESAQTSPEKTPQTPKRRAGRPKGAKNKRSPTPEGDIPPHERYFFQNRAAPANTSNNTLNRVPLLTHEEYFEKLSQYVDPCSQGKEFLLSLHRRSFAQWYFELHEEFNICLYGYGSKRKLVQQFADWLCRKHNAAPPTIVIVNGRTPNISVRSIFSTIVTAILGDETPSKLGSQPTEVLELLQSALKTRSSQSPVVVLINSIDAPPLRRAVNQALLARLATTPLIHLLVTADTPNFSLMWDISLRDQFNFVYHDCTTFSPYEAELDVVEEVHQLLGRRGRRVGGKEGVGFVLKSLPENARNLYRLLLTELITMLDDGHGSDDDMDDGAAAAGGKSNEEAGVEFRMLYQKASEDFIASSEMMFRTLLKEFHDHQMITSRMDSSGSELLGVPLSREEMEGVLEDLVLG